MRSRIFSSKYIKTVSKGQAWIPAFLTLGFILAFPVIGLEKLGSWRNLGYTQDQITLLYYRLWKDGFVLTGMAVAMAAGFMNAVNGFLYLYSRKKTDFYHSLPMKRSELFCRKGSNGTDLLSGAIYRYRISDSLCWGSEGAFQPGTYGNGSKNAVPSPARFI